MQLEEHRFVPHAQRLLTPCSCMNLDEDPLY